MDRRVKYTKKIIEETFLNLLEEKDISKITVSEMCTIADINRATFYRYYLDVYDLLKQIQNNFINSIKESKPMEELPKDSIFNFTKGILEVLVSNQKLVKILFDTNNNIYFLNEVIEVAYEKCFSKWESKKENYPEVDLQYAIIFVFNGALGVINYWVKNDFLDETDEIAKNIEQLVLNGIKKYIKD